jgi:membrane protein
MPPSSPPEPSTQTTTKTTVQGEPLSLTWPNLWFLVRETAREWDEDKAPRLGAALAFYSVLSLGPLLLIVVSIAGLAFGAEAPRALMLAEIRHLIGNEGAEAIAGVLTRSQTPTSGIIGTIIGLVTLFISATGFFAQLQDALNTIWNVEPRAARHWSGFIKKRLLSFAMIIGTGLLLLLSLVVSAGLSAVSGLMSHLLPVTLMHVVNILLSFGLITLIFALTFKFLPDIQIAWQDVWIGAVITAGLFVTGKFFIGLYLGHSALMSIYGAAGSLMVILVWIYYSTQIFFFGAEFTQVYSRHIGSHAHERRRKKRALKQAKKYRAA